MKWLILRYDDFRSLELWEGVVRECGLEYEEDEEGNVSPEEITIIIASARGVS